jgi:MoxR-like ATPase
MGYSFDLIPPRPDLPHPDPAQLALRPCLDEAAGSGFKEQAPKFVPGERFAAAINTAIAVGEPLLITGEPGTGKTQAAYYTAWQLGLGEVIHFQVKSETTARDLLYHFDTVQYFHDAHLQRNVLGQNGGSGETLDRSKYVQPRALWLAFERAKETGRPAVLLIDEIDKAPRDFPNDLLHELDQMEFTIAETGERKGAPKAHRPILFITSNSERRLPEPFLRRCVYHHIRFEPGILKQALDAHRDAFQGLNDDFLELAKQRFLALRNLNLRKKPATGECLVWLRLLALAADPQGRLTALEDKDLARLPYLGALVKDHGDLEEVARSGRGG